MTMTTTDPSRKYDVVLIGATGYTGALTADHIALHLPTNLRWAIAGRSPAKLEALAARLEELSPDRLQPAVEVVALEERSPLHELVGNAKVCISVVSYFRVGEAVIEACVENGTDYIDCAGGQIEIRQWIAKYHKKAEASGVILIHSCGVFSAPHDLLSWLVVRSLAEKYSEKTKEVIVSGTEVPSDPSGGSLEYILHAATMDPRVARESVEPWALSPVRGSQTSSATNFLGLRTDPHLGLLAACALGASENRSTVHRTWGLFEGTAASYGPNFQYNEYQKTTSTLIGAAQVLKSYLFRLALTLAPLRYLARKFLAAPGEGPDLEKSMRYSVEIEAVAVADSGPDGAAHRAYASFSYPHGPYPTTALFLAHAAASLSYHRKLEGQLAGGCLTPAFLGNDLLTRIQDAGATVKTSLL
ncbi:Saccharopine dehydrogenase-domain-containing protein [Biscogniauxia marginata]|nr:Saccharopine dehydrogenase-domain-containing protein [Biscogniauxia marginata]